MKRKVTLISSFVIIAMVLTMSMVYANSDNSSKISKSFDDLKMKLEQVKGTENNLSDTNTAVAKIEDLNIAIDEEQFIFYKHNRELTNSLRDDAAQLNDQQMIDALLIEELTVNEAMRQGIVVTDAELDEAINYQRDVYNNFEPVDNEQQLALEMMKNRIRITELTEEEFWKSEDVREMYRKAILGGKLMNELMVKGTIKDSFEFQNYQNQLLEKVKDQVSYNNQLIN